MNWQEHALREKEDSLALEIFPADKESDALRDPLSKRMKEVGGCGWCGGTI